MAFEAEQEPAESRRPTLKCPPPDVPYDDIDLYSDEYDDSED